MGVIYVAAQSGFGRDQLQCLSHLSPNRTPRLPALRAHPLLLRKTVLHYLHRDVIRHHILRVSGLPPGMGCHLGGLLRSRRGSIRPRLVEQQAQLAIQLPLALLARISAKHTSFSAVRSAGTLRLYFARWLRCLILAVLAPLCLPPKIYPPASSAMYDSRVHGTLFELYCIFSHPVFLCKTLGDLTLTVIPSLNQQFMRLIM